LVRLGRVAVQRDLDRERPPFGEVVGDPRRYERAVREQRDEKSTSPGVRIDVEEVPPRQYLAACVQQPQAPCVCELLEDPPVLFTGQSAIAGGVVAQRQVVVAVESRERAAPGDLDRPFQRERPVDGGPMETGAERAVALLGHHVIRPRLASRSRNSTTSARAHSGATSYSRLRASTSCPTVIGVSIRSQILEPTSFNV